MLEVSTIDIIYSKTQALWGVSLKIDEVELVALVGAKGAGKWRITNVSYGPEFDVKAKTVRH